jgi:hypothetical protein
LGVRSTIIGHRGRSALAALRRLALDRADLADDGVERGGHLLMHLHGLRALDEIRLVAVAHEQRPPAPRG